MRFDLVLFDSDGTLVDSLPDIAGALNHALAASGLEPLSLDVVRGLVGEGVQRLVEKALVVQKAQNLDAVAITRQVVAIYTDRPCLNTRIYPGVVELLVRLRAHGVRLAVVTNKVGSVARALLDELHMKDSFDAVIGEGDGHGRKPSPDAAVALMKQFGVDPRRTLMVGDGLPDLALARAAGCSVAGVTWGYTPTEVITAQAPDYLLSTPAELAEIVT